MSTPTAPSAREIIYVGDPMCSWCWGIAPALDEVRRRRPDLPLQVMAGGLRPGPAAREVDDELAQFLGEHWDEVSRRTGQPFARAVLSRRDWSYDTEPGCRAVVTMRALDADRAWPLFKRLQMAFYAQGELLGEDPEAYREYVEDVGGDADAFVDAFVSDSAKEATTHDFATVQRWGITGFPTIIAREGETGSVVAAGYLPADDLEAALDSALPARDEPPSCAPGEIC